MSELVAEAKVTEDAGHGISFGEAFRIWLKIALLSFGGPAGQIAVMHRILVEEKNWISESRFLHALNYCMLLPGPEAQQLATYIGWLLHRTAGGIMAGGLFILPGVISIMALSWIYAAYGNVSFIEALFFGLKAAVLAIVIQAVVRVGKRALRNRIMIALAAANRSRWTPQLAATARGAVPLSRNARIEAALGACVLAVVGVLGISIPAAHDDVRWPFAFRLAHGDPLGCGAAPGGACRRCTAPGAPS